jgi:hypothetical protein
VRSPASRAACFTQLRIACAEGSNWRANSSGVRPVRTNSMIRCRNSGEYGGWLFGIVDLPFRPNDGVSTKAGQLQIDHDGDAAAVASLPDTGAAPHLKRMVPREPAHLDELPNALPSAVGIYQQAQIHITGVLERSFIPLDLGRKHPNVCPASMDNLKACGPGGNKRSATCGRGAPPCAPGGQMEFRRELLSVDDPRRDP